MSIFSIVRSLPAPRLPLAVDRLTLVAHLADIKPIDEFELSVGIVTPSGQHAATPGSGRGGVLSAGCHNADRQFELIDRLDVREVCDERQAIYRER